MSKPQIPVTNLKERIAALEQQRNAGKPSRATSPSPGLGGSAGGPSVGALRDKIAKFEKKGGVPVPRGTFGLGAPPPPEARVQKKGELYGNRIPQPVRMVSANHTGNSGGVTSHSTGGGMGTGIGMGQPPSRSSSSMGFNYDRDYRRSVSMSSVITDLDDRPDYTPLTSPTFNFPDSPGSTVYTPEGSPSPLGSPDGSATIQTVMTAANARPPVMPRSTSFAEAVERAKKVAEAKGGVVGEKVQEGSAPTPFIAAAVKDQFEPNGQPKSLVEGGEEKEGRPLTEEPTAIDDTALPPTPATGATTSVQVVVENDEPPTPTAAGSPVDSTESQSPTSPPSSAPVEPDTPTAVVSPISELLQELAPNSEVQAPAAGETKKPANRNNKDLSLDVEALKIQSATGAPANDAPKPAAAADDTTPTTATYANLLSPPQTGNSVLSSGSSVSPRPYSMVELSWAERVTPATSRGNVMFLPPSSTQLPRKTDLINYPPTPTEADSKPQDGGNKKANGSATTRTAASSKPTTFTAVVHKKIREAEVALPAGPHELPQTPRKQKRMTMMPFQSPGNPELLSLLQNAVMLESTLEHGELPTEVAKKKEEEEKERERERQAQELAAALAADKARAELEEQKRLAFEDQKAKEQEEEDEAARKAKLRHTFLIPLSKARYQHKKEMSVASARAAGVEVELDETGLPELPERLPSPGGKEEEEEKPRMSIHHNLPPPPPHIPPQPQPQPQPPQADSLAPAPKSAGSKSRFSTFRRLGSVKSMIGGPGAASRKSIASDFSDDTTYSSIPAVITPDGSVAHGDVDDFGMTSVNHSQEQSWPSLSPKKSGGGSRTSTFGKMFSRSRTKSSGSTLSNASAITSDSASSKAPSVYTLPPLPDTLSAIPSGPEYENRQPRRSISMKSLKSALKGRSSIDSTNAPPLPRTRTVDAQPPPPVLESNGSTSPTSTLGSPGPLKSPDYLGYNSLNPPMDTGNGGRPTSLVSVASTLPSPLFDKDIFDAFPAVPSGTPASASQYDQGQGMPSAALLTPSFDSVFLGSAIHLAGSHKSTIGTPTTATGGGGMYSPLPPASAATVDGSAGSSSRQRRA